MVGIPSASASSVRQRYLLLVPIPVMVDADGRKWVDRLWHKDLLRHFDYIEHLALLAPGEVLHQDQVMEGMQMLPTKAGFEVVLLPSQRSRLRALIGLPLTLWRIFREVRRADIVHSGFVGWPYPLGWPANVFALLLRKNLLLVVESAPWRSQLRRRFPRGRLVYWTYELCARFFASRADLLIATQPEYVSGLRSARSHGRYAVHPATWIDEETIVSTVEAQQRWNARLEADGTPLRLLFAARLVADKGAALVIELARRLARDDSAVQVDVIGDGDMRTALEKEANRLGDGFLRVLKPVTYGPEFFRLLATYDAVLVPSLGDEQPRIVYDAYSQGVPVVASATAGLRSCVEHGLTGWIFEAGSAEALHQRVLALVAERAPLRVAGLAALDVAKRHTHRAMHRDRCELILEVFGDKSTPGSA